jgi:hypothetical protein
MIRNFSIVAKLFLVASAPFVAAGVPAHAQNAERAENEIICISILRLWQGSIEDTRQIDMVPVPKSFVKVWNRGILVSRCSLIAGV